MQQEKMAAVDDPRPRPAPTEGGVCSELDGLRATCRRQARVIEALSVAVSTLRTGAAALKAENADLRAVHDGGPPRRRAYGGGALVVRVPLDVHAPGAARTAVAQCLDGRVSATLIANAQLVVSELVTNSVCHSGAAAGAVVVVRVQSGHDTVRLEVEDPGCGGVVAPRAPDLVAGGGFGLNVVQALSERWGLERVAAGGTRVWAHLPDTAVAEDTDAGRQMGRFARSGNGRPANGRAVAAPQRQRATRQAS